MASWSAMVSAADIKNVRIWLAPDHTRLVFDLSGALTHKVFSLKNPDRIVLDIPKAKMLADLKKISLDKSPIKRIRYGRNGDILRVVLDLSKKVRPKSFALKPNQKYGHRLVVDLFDDAKVVKQVQKAAPASTQSGQRRDIVVAIDAGHGGEDPGAIGPTKLREKDVVLAIAKEVKRLFDSTKGYNAVLTRDRDYYVSLRGRTSKARKQNADLFISIHADAFKDPRAKGASVWVLSSSGASSEMGRWLASKENNTDLIGGVGSVSLEDKDNVLASVLLDMSMTASRADSRDVADNIHNNLAKFAKMHKKHTERAGFVVLKSPDIPSVLVETGFISNPQEERLLKTKSYQRKMAKAVYDGVIAHFKRKPPMMSYVAHQVSKEPVTYKVAPGDTLSLIAVRNGVDVAAIRKANALNSDVIRVGQVLKIPSS
ncbi:MAG: N-acetylmuramoyl-L-alanine amidase [Pontibacterium sp.]